MVATRKNSGKGRNSNASARGDDLEGSPHRKQRIQEKEEFSSLNTRLERYIMAVREREAGSNNSEAMSFTETLQEELTKVQNDYEEKIMELRTDNERASSENVDLLRQFEKERKLRNQAQIALEEAKSKRDELQNDLLALNDKASENEAAFKEAEQTKRDLELKLKQAEKEIKSLKKEIERLSSESQTVSGELFELRSRYNSSTEDARQTERRLNDSIATLQNELDELRPANEELENRIRSEMNEQTRRLVEEARQGMESQKNQQLDEQERLFKSKIEEILRKLTETETLLDSTRVTNIEMENHLQASERQNAALERQAASLQQEIDQLRSELSELESRPMEGSEEKEAELESLRSQVQDLRSELSDLLPLRIPLEHAIQNYETLVEEEEKHLENAPATPGKPSKKLAKSKKKSSPQKDSSPVRNARASFHGGEDEDTGRSVLGKRRRTQY